MPPAPEVAPKRSAPAPRGTTPAIAGAAARVDDLSRELALLDRAKRALADGDVDAAAGALDLHAHEFPHGRLAQESIALRIRVLVRRGERARALTLYRTLAASEPTSPHLESLRELLGIADDAPTPKGPTP